MKFKLPSQKVLYIIIGGVGLFLTFYIWRKSKGKASEPEVLPGTAQAAEGSTEANRANEERELRQKGEAEERSERSMERAEGKENKEQAIREAKEEREAALAAAREERAQINYEKAEAREANTKERQENFANERSAYELEHPSNLPVQTPTAQSSMATVQAHARARAVKEQPARATHKTPQATQQQLLNNPSVASLQKWVAAVRPTIEHQGLQRPQATVVGSYQAPQAFSGYGTSAPPSVRQVFAEKPVLQFSKPAPKAKHK